MRAVSIRLLRAFLAADRNTDEQRVETLFDKLCFAYRSFLERHS